MKTDKLEQLAIKIGPTGRHFVRAHNDKERVFFLGDTAWQLFHRLTREESIEYLDTRAAQGFTVILACVLAELDVVKSNIVFGPDGLHVSDDAASDGQDGSLFLPNRYGEVPLINDDPKTPNPAYFEHVDFIVEQAAERGILIAMVPSWSRWINTGWHGPPVLFDESSARAYGEYIGARYPYLPKLLGGDSNPVWTDGSQIWKTAFANGRKMNDLPLPTLDGLPRNNCHHLIEAMAEGIRVSEGPSAVLTYHPTALWLPWGPEATASAFFGDKEWLTLDGCQSGHADFPNLVFDKPSLEFWDTRASHVPLTKMWNSGKVRPIIDLESHYEDMHNALDGNQPRIWDGHDIRSGAWQSLLSGACGVVYGTNSIWQMYDAARRDVVTAVCGLSPEDSWQTDLKLKPGPKYLAILKDYFTSLPEETYHSRRPAQDLLTATSAPDDVAQRDGRIDVMSNADGKWILAHSGQGYRFELDLSSFGSTPVQAVWLDPRTGTRTKVEESLSGQKIWFTPPSTGSTADDWVLEVTGL